MIKQHNKLRERFRLLSQKEARDELKITPDQLKELIRSGDLAKSNIKMLVSFTNKKQIRDFVGDFIQLDSLIAYKQGSFEQVNCKTTKVR